MYQLSLKFDSIAITEPAYLQDPDQPIKSVEKML